MDTTTWINRNLYTSRTSNWPPDKPGWLQDYNMQSWPTVDIHNNHLERNLNEVAYDFDYGLLHSSPCGECRAHIQHLLPHIHKGHTRRLDIPFLFSLIYSAAREEGLGEGLRRGSEDNQHLRALVSLLNAQLDNAKKEIMILQANRSGLSSTLKSSGSSAPALQVSTDVNQGNAAVTQSSRNLTCELVSRDNEFVRAVSPIDRETYYSSRPPLLPTRTCAALSAALPTSPKTQTGASNQRSTAAAATSPRRSGHSQQQQQQQQQQQLSPNAGPSSPTSARGTGSGHHRRHSGMSNPTLDDDVSVWYKYYKANLASWPRGVRQDTQGGPLITDLRADRAVAKMCPRSDYIPETTEPRSPPLQPPSQPTAGSSTVVMDLEAEGIAKPQPPKPLFKALMAELFSQPGLYQQRVRELGLTIASNQGHTPGNAGPSYRPFDQRSLTFHDIVVHLTQCGVTFEIAERDFEGWSEAYLAGVNCSVPKPAGAKKQQTASSAPVVDARAFTRRRLQQ
ncbi:hypothetical protein CC1G_06304 [Coprinopsis cinerea okayama7|uniref:Uncharacterized protein n=1 Tax=Coprinopsis cinerea (strain Okayama-7 / 130 / ATCC MYA-4618 / FGSC 9003) TaxID=240176 RepID=A8NTF9_COPC7|nr:hypothetical protein CC1G_06304 [Coprinopsis cinerea okayama7\|eukprot:XP_001836219.2 hypothetical protein CC1G_06304 [Coprinopsis cinerea okayama7\